MTRELSRHLAGLSKTSRGGSLHDLAGHTIALRQVTLMIPDIGAVYFSKKEWNL
jgi:hypothetical protein